MKTRDLTGMDGKEYAKLITGGRSQFVSLPHGFVVGKRKQLKTPWCIVGGCVNRHASAGLCQNHVRRLYLHDNVLENRQFTGLYCNVVGCGKRRRNKGMCRSHYDRSRYHNDGPLESKATNPDRISTDTYQIAYWLKQGKSLRAVSDLTGLSHQRISQIRQRHLMHRSPKTGKMIRTGQMREYLEGYISWLKKNHPEEL